MCDWEIRPERGEGFSVPTGKCSLHFLANTTDRSDIKVSEVSVEEHLL